MDETTVVRGRRPGAGWTRVAHGLHRRSTETASHLDDLRAWQLVLPASGRFTHLTAAEAYGWWLPPRPEGLPLVVAVDAAASRPQRPGLLVSRHADLEPPVLRDGVPLAPPAETLLACARDLRLLDLVVLCDAALHLRACTREQLEELTRRRRRGAPMLRAALHHADARSESPWESLLRMLHVVLEVPVEPQRVVEDAHGSLVARGDLWIRGTRTLHEYDGGEHLTRRRQRDDLARLRRLADEGWLRRGYTSVEVLHQATGILRDADRSLGRLHRPGRVRAWYALLGESLFSSAGRARFTRRPAGR